MLVEPLLRYFIDQGFTLVVPDLRPRRFWWASGFFFGTSDRNKDVGSRPFGGSAVNNRPRGYLVEAKILDGETPIVSGWVCLIPCDYWVVRNRKSLGT